MKPETCNDCQPRHLLHGVPFVILLSCLGAVAHVTIYGGFHTLLYVQSVLISVILIYLTYAFFTFLEVRAEFNECVYIKNQKGVINLENISSTRSNNDSGWFDAHS